MYLKQMHVKNFRCIENSTIYFNEGLNVIIGANNCGKTAILDALRLGLSVGIDRRDIYVSIDDFFVNKNGDRLNEIEIDLTFSGTTKEEEGIFIELMKLNEDGSSVLELHHKYRIDFRNGIEKVRHKYWGGETEGTIIPLEIMELFYFIYLEALRNPERNLRPIRGNRLGQLFMKLIPKTEDQESHARILNDKIRSSGDWENLINTAKRNINIHLDGTTIKNSNQKVDIDFVPLNFKRIVEDLKLFIPMNDKLPNEKLDGKIQSLEIYQNGLGYNNLIYIATVLGDLIERKNRVSEYYLALLIEEPEAHLHPQLQNVLFNYFKDLEGKGIQIFITSHSPTITAKTDIDAVIVMENKETLELLAIKDLDFEDRKYKKYIQRFLDVTKSQLFFAEGVILVEGISEAILIHIFADMIGENLDKNGIEVVNVGGLNFKPFAKLFLSDNTNKRLNLRCAVVSDDDRKDGVMSGAAKKLSELKGENLEICFAERTFEYELFKNNKDIMIRLYKKMHPRFNPSGSDEDKWDSFIQILKSNKDKGEFAQLLATELEENKYERDRFEIPKYIINSIQWVIHGVRE